MSEQISLKELHQLCMRAAKAFGATTRVARSLADATVTAEAEGQHIVGLSHFFDYLDAFAAGRIDPKAEPELRQVKPAIFHSDAKGGLAQLGFDRAFARLVKAAKKHGISLFSQTNGWTCGSLGYHVERLAHEGLMALAATNGSAMIAGGGATKPIYCTNPLAFAAPTADDAPLLIDQSSSATAFVNIRDAAARGDTIPDGWAIDKDGKPTTDPKAAMEGALLAFGGSRGANIALMVEVLAAGTSGANWSVDAPLLFEGEENSRTGLTIIVIDPTILAPDFPERLSRHLTRLSEDYGVHVPGRAKARARLESVRDGVEVPDGLLGRLKSASARKSP